MVNHLETIVAPSAIQKLKKLAEPPPPPPPAVAFGPGDAHKSSPLEVRRRGGAPEQVGRRFDGGFDEFVPTACTPPLTQPTACILCQACHIKKAGRSFVFPNPILGTSLPPSSPPCCRFYPLTYVLFCVLPSSLPPSLLAFLPLSVLSLIPVTRPFVPHSLSYVHVLSVQYLRTYYYARILTYVRAPSPMALV